MFVDHGNQTPTALLLHRRRAFGVHTGLIIACHRSMLAHQADHTAGQTLLVCVCVFVCQPFIF